MGANEHGLVVGNVAVFTRERVGPPGLTGMDLVRLRARARGRRRGRGPRVLAALIETHGQGGGCGHENRRFTYHNSFMLADPRRALLVETAGKAVTVERVTGARTISNALTVPGFAEAHADPPDDPPGLRARTPGLHHVGRRSRADGRATSSHCCGATVPRRCPATPS